MQLSIGPTPIMGAIFTRQTMTCRVYDQTTMDGQCMCSYHAQASIRWIAITKVIVESIAPPRVTEHGVCIMGSSMACEERDAITSVWT